MVNKSLYQILEGQEVLLNSVISSLDLNETSSRTVRPMLEYLRQDIKAHLQDLQGPCSTTQTQVDLGSVDMHREVYLLRKEQDNHRGRLSELEQFMERTIGDSR